MSGAVPPPAARPLERAARVPRPVCPGCGRCGRGDPAPAPRRAPLRAGVARRGGGGRASPGGAFHRCEGRMVSGAVPPLAARPLERAARVPRPVCPGCGRCRRGDPAPVSQRAPLWAGVARCGSGRRVSPGGGAFHRCEGRPVSGAVPPLAVRPLERAARVPRPVFPGCGRCGRGDSAPAPQRAPLRAGVARCGGGGRTSPGGPPSTIVRGVWCQALSLSWPPVLWSGQPGFRVPCVPGAVGAGVGTKHRPHGVRPCGLASLAVGVAEGRPRGVPSTVVRGAWCQALSLRWPPVLWSGQPGFRVPCVPGAVAAGVGTQHRSHSACDLAGQRCSPWGWRKGVPGGGAFHRCEGRPVSGAVSPLAARPPKRAARVPRPVCPGRGRCWCGDPAPAPQRAPLRAGDARCGGGRGASPGGGVLSTVVRGAWCQALSLPWPPVLLERAARVPRRACPGCGRCGRADSAPAPQRAPLRAGVARCGCGGRASPGGVPSSVVRGAWCQALSLPRPPVLWSGQPGFRVPCVPGAVGAGVGTHHRPHSVRPCGLALLAVRVAEGRPRGGCFPPL